MQKLWYLEEINILAVQSLSENNTIILELDVEDIQNLINCSVKEQEILGHWQYIGDI